jgi:uridylate kinase
MCVYDCDPEKCFGNKIWFYFFEDVLKKGLNVMDTTALH